MATRRSYGTGSLDVRTDSGGAEAWYGRWRADGTQVKRRIGKKRTEGCKDGLTRRQAEAELRRLIAEYKPSSRPVAGGRPTIAELGRVYVAHLERAGRKKATIVAVRSALAVWLVPHFGDKAIDAIRSQDVADLMRKMESTGAGTRDKPVGPKSIRNYIGTLSALFNYAIDKEIVTTNPAAHVDLPGVARNEDIRFLDPLEVQALADGAVDGDYQAVDRALYLTAAMTGLRQGELVALRWCDVDWKAARVRVRQNHVLGEYGTPKSKRSTRSVPMADLVAGELDRLHKVSAFRGDTDLVFADPVGRYVRGEWVPAGGPLSKAAILRRYRRALKAARLDESRVFHDLRHTFGTRMAAAGVPMRMLQEWMGHRDIETTQIYADYAPSAHEAALVAAAFDTSGAGRPALTVAA